MAYYNGTGTGLETILYGEVAWAGVDEAYDMEVVRYAKPVADDLSKYIFIGCIYPQPFCIAWNGYDGPNQEHQFYHDGGIVYRNCATHELYDWTTDIDRLRRIQGE